MLAFAGHVEQSSNETERMDEGSSAASSAEVTNEELQQTVNNAILEPASLAHAGELKAPETQIK